MGTDAKGSRAFWDRPRARKGLLLAAVMALGLSLLGGPIQAHPRGRPDVTVVKTAGNATINAGDVASFTMTVTNIGTKNAKKVVLDDTLPDSGLVWTENPDLAQCAITGSELHCDIGTLVPGGSFSVTVEALTDRDDCGILENTATVWAKNEKPEERGNNSSSASIEVLCPPLTVPGRMTGGGSAFVGELRVTHGFELHCSFPEGTAPREPNRLEINWEGNRFHLESITKADCTDDPNIGEKPPVAGFDTYDGAGFGRYNGVSGAFAEWTLVDAGEPGTSDTFTLSIVDADGNLVLELPTAFLDHGNHQAHKAN